MIVALFTILKDKISHKDKSVAGLNADFPTDTGLAGVIGALG